MSGINQGRVVVITGAGRGIGREYALEFARTGAKVVVNDLGSAPDGSGAETGPAFEVAEEIRALGGEAIVNTDDVSDWDGAGRMIQAAIDTFGGLDVLVNNAGILRDRTLASMTVEDFDAVVKVHLRGTFCPTKHAVTYWRSRSKAGDPVDGRLINTSSASGLFGNVGQANYGAAKAGIANFTIIASLELDRYGVTSNAVYPGAMSRLTEGLIAGGEEGRRHPMDPFYIAPVVAWLGSPASRSVNGRLIGLRGGEITIGQGWEDGPSAASATRWEMDELSEVVPALVGKARANTTMVVGKPPATQA
ncbi:SDR family oxidoreductase [Streptomyces sp. NBC_00656]|uniref:SDR family oxidoreductase n=1 Tax=Streptomyces sp. NBC_00656 TaxID=2903668 RepID=UPI0032513469